MKANIRGIIVTIALLGFGCSGKDASPAGNQKAPPPQPPPAAEDAAPDKVGFSGMHRQSEENQDWVPAEYKTAGRWRDAAVYLDGVPIGVMWYGELPSTVQPVWLDDVQMLEFKAGDKGPREKKIKVRRYRLVDYFEGLGVDMSKVHEVHIYGGKGFAAVTSGAQVRKFRDTLYFSFGRETSGKPLIYLPSKLDINTSFDHIAAITLYANKKAPKLRDDGDLELDGKIVHDVPYFGEPVRGGVRVYIDDHLAVTIKRRLLEANDEITYKTPEGDLRWKLLAFLRSQGATFDQLAGGIVIMHEEEIARLTGDQLEAMYFTANPQSSGKVLLGDEGLRMQALMLYSKELPPKRNEVPPPIED